MNNYEQWNLKKKGTKQTSRTGIDSQKHHMEGYQQGSGRGENGGKCTGNKKHKWQVENRGRLEIVQEVEKPKNLYV